MHLIQNSKPKKATPLVPVTSIFAVPGVRKMRGRRYRNGVDIGPCGPPKPVPDVAAVKAVKRAYAEAAKKGPVKEGSGFDIARLRLTSGRILVTRGKAIKEEGGIALPESQWKNVPGWIVVRTAPDVTACAPGDRLIVQSKHKLRPVDLGGVRFFLTRESVIVALLENDAPVLPCP